MKINNLCCASVTRKGSDENSVADTAPRPRVINKIGSAQQIRVADDVKRINQPQRPLSSLLTGVSMSATVLLVFVLLLIVVLMLILGIFNVRVRLRVVLNRTAFSFAHVAVGKTFFEKQSA